MADRLRGIRILHEDPDVIVIEKPAGLLVQALRHGREPSVESLLTDYVRKGQWKSRRQTYLVHRLDRETSGVMVVAKSEAVQDYFRSKWNELTEKTYLARVEGVMETNAGVFESYLCEDADLFVRSTTDKARGKYARTEWKVLATDAATTLAEVALKTGRKNQIRVHFAEAGHPVVGDAKYGRGKARQPLCLLAWKLRLLHPHTRKWMEFEARRPPFCTLSTFPVARERKIC